MYKTRAKFIESSLNSADSKVNYGNALRGGSKKNNSFLMRKASKIKVGAIVEGEVIELKDSGAIINVNGIKGFLPISQISDSWLKHPSEGLTIRSIIKLKVIFKGIDKKGRFSLKLSRKAIFRSSTKNQKKSNPVKSKSKRKLDDFYDNIKSYIKELGSLEAVYSYYAGDSHLNEYARKVAPKLLNIPKHQLIKFLSKLENSASALQREKIIKLLNEKELGSTSIAIKCGVKPEVVCAFKDHLKIDKHFVLGFIDPAKEVSQTNPQTDGDSKSQRSDVESSDFINCAECGVLLKKKNLSKHIKKVHNNLRKKAESNKTNVVSQILTDLYIPNKSYIWIPPKANETKESCPGCGARYGCYCR